MARWSLRHIRTIRVTGAPGDERAAPTGTAAAVWHRTGAAVHEVALGASGDLRCLLVAFEQGLKLFDEAGHLRFELTLLNRPELPYTTATLTPDLRWGFAAERGGEVYALEFAEPGRSVHGERIYFAERDLYKLVTDDGGNLIAVGHYGPLLTGLSRYGTVLWQRTTDERTWVVAISPEGEHVVAGSSGGAINAVMLLSGQHGEPRAIKRFEHRRFTAVAALGEGCVVAYHESVEDRACVAAYSSSLAATVWECETESQTVSLAVDRAGQFVVFGQVGGVVAVHEATGGARLVASDPLGNVVTSVAIVPARVGDNRRLLAAGTTSGEVYLFGLDML